MIYRLIYVCSSSHSLLDNFSSKMPVKIQYFLSHSVLRFLNAAPSVNVFVAWRSVSIINFGGCKVSAFQWFIKPFRSFYLTLDSETNNGIVNPRPVIRQLDSPTRLNGCFMFIEFCLQTNAFAVHQPSINVIFAFNIYFYAWNINVLDPQLSRFSESASAITTHRISRCGI